MSRTPCPLSERELEVLRLMATGATNQQIARELVISVNTVKVHVRNIFEKLGVQSRTEATYYAIQEGWIPVERVTTPAEEVAPAPQPAGLQAFLSRPRLVAALAAALVLVALPLVWLVMPGWRSPASKPTPAVFPGGTSPKRWNQRAPLPTARSGLALAAHAGHVYAIAGQDEQGVTGLVHRYDPTTDTWISLAEKPIPVKDVGAAVVGGRVYVPGGCDAQDHPINTLAVYDPESDSWTTETPLPVPLCAYAIAALEGRVYVFGGWDGESYRADTWQYDPDSWQWTRKTAMPTARAYAGAAVVEGKIFVIGGYDGSDLSANEAYEPTKDRDGGQPWSKHTPLPEGRAGPGVTALGSTIYLVGGGWEKPAGNPLQYDVRRDAWEAFEPATTDAWRNLGLVAVDTKLYAVGGWDGHPVDTNAEYIALFRIFIPVPR